MTCEYRGLRNIVITRPVRSICLAILSVSECSLFSFVSWCLGDSFEMAWLDMLQKSMRNDVFFPNLRKHSYNLWESYGIEDTYSKKQTNKKPHKMKFIGQSKSFFMEQIFTRMRLFFSKPSWREPYKSFLITLTYWGALSSCWTSKEILLRVVYKGELWVKHPFLASYLDMAGLRAIHLIITKYFLVLFYGGQFVRRKDTLNGSFQQGPGPPPASSCRPFFSLPRSSICLGFCTPLFQPLFC